MAPSVVKGSDSGDDLDSGKDEHFNGAAFSLTGLYAGSPLFALYFAHQDTTEIMKKLLLLLALALPLAAQINSYSATTGDVVLSGAGTAFTIQQPATNAKQVQLVAAVIYCSVSCSVQQSQNGTAATATAGTITGTLPLSTVPSSATAWTASNAGGGTGVGPIYHLAATQTITLTLAGMTMGNTGTGTNYTITISSITGTANVAIFWSER